MRKFKPELTPWPQKGACVPLDRLPRPLDLEIGSGSGEFAFYWAKRTRNPLIAIEKTRTRFLKFEKKCKKEDRVQKIWPVNSNAVWWLAHYGKPSMFERVFLLYPNPYPKKKQAHLRWINRPFMSFLLSLLKKGGQLELRTNKLYYYKEFKAKIRRWDFMQVQEDRNLEGVQLKKGVWSTQELSEWSQSLFEKKYLERGDTCYILKYQKI